MARRHKSHSSSTPRFVALPHYMLRSPAWRSLKPVQRAVLIDLWARHNGANNGEISYSVREAEEETGISYSTASRALVVLVERGFLRVRRDSKFSLKTKEARVWEITAESCAGTPATKDFMRCKPFEDDPSNISRLHHKAEQLHQRNREREDVIKLPASVAPMQPTEPETAPPRLHPCNTYNLPGGNASNERAGSVPSVSSSPQGGSIRGRAEMAAGAPATLIPLSDPALSRRPDPDVADVGTKRSDVGDGEQLDLVEYIEGEQTKSAETRDDELRAALRRHIDTEGRGAIKRIAESVGLSRPTLSNFVSGRFGINAGAAAMLREMVTR